MKIAEVEKIIGNIRKGSLFRIGYTSEVPVTVAASKSGYVITKHTEKTVRTGVKYAHIKNAPISAGNGNSKPWFHWKSQKENVIATKNSDENTHYLAIAPIKNSRTVTRWEINGVPASKQDVIDSGLVRASYWNGSSPVFQLVGVDNITKISQKKVSN